MLLGFVLVKCVVEFEVVGDVGENVDLVCGVLVLI